MNDRQLVLVYRQKRGISLTKTKKKTNNKKEGQRQESKGFPRESNGWNEKRKESKKVVYRKSGERFFNLTEGGDREKSWKRGRRQNTLDVNREGLGVYSKQSSAKKRRGKGGDE